MARSILTENGLDLSLCADIAENGVSPEMAIELLDAGVSEAELIAAALEIVAEDLYSLVMVAAFAA